MPRTDDLFVTRSQLLSMMRVGVLYGGVEHVDTVSPGERLKIVDKTVVGTERRGATCVMRTLVSWFNAELRRRGCWFKCRLAGIRRRDHKVA